MKQAWARCIYWENPKSLFPTKSERTVTVKTPQLPRLSVVDDSGCEQMEKEGNTGFKCEIWFGVEGSRFYFRVTEAWVLFINVLILSGSNKVETFLATLVFYIHYLLTGIYLFICTLKFYLTFLSVPVKVLS